MAVDPTGIASCICTSCVEPICRPILAKCQTALSQKIDSFLFLERNCESLDTEKKDLEAEATGLQRNMLMEVNMLNECDDDIKLLEERIQRLQESEIPSTEKEYARLARCFCGCTPNLKHRYRLGKRVSGHLAQVRALFAQAKERNAAKLTSKKNGAEITWFSHKPAARAVEELETICTVGITSKLTELKSYVHEERRKIIGVYGTGGVGKSTLLRELNNDFLNGTCGFQVVIYVTVSNMNDLNVEAIQSKISERLDLPWDESQSPSERATTLYRVLRRKSFVLLLDDVWKSFELETIGIPYPKDGSNGKLILASRCLQVCTQMGSNRNNIKVQPLEKEESWTLFKNNLIEEAANAIESDSVKPYARKVVKSCQGLPLALNVIGKAVATTISIDDWMNVSKMIKTSIAGLSEVDKLLARLEISYSLLEADLRPCFLYCCLFPEDYSIRKDKLVEYWIAEGYIGDASGSSPEEAFELGLHHIQKLKDSSLLEKGDAESEVKMHDIIREMARWVACQRGDKKLFYVKAGDGLKEAPRDIPWNEAQKLSLMNNSIKELHYSPQCSALQTLFLQSNPKLVKLPDHFFRFMPSLRVLDLSYTRLKHLPIEDGALPELLYLNLSNTGISELPIGLGSLRKLLHLDLSRTSCLLKVPCDVISRLSVIQVLNMYSSQYGEWIVDDMEFNKSGVPLKELAELTKLQTLGITVQSVVVLNKLFEHHILSEATKYLRLEYCQDLKAIHIPDFRHITHIKELSIDSCNQLNEIMLNEVAADHLEDCNIEKTNDESDPEDGIWEKTIEVEDGEEASLEVLNLAILPNLVNISWGLRPIPLLERLRELSIRSCRLLENVSWILQLHSLEMLIISDCREIATVVEDKVEMQVEKQSAFSKLQVIRLKKLPRLKTIFCARTLPALKTITILDCPNLKKLPLGPGCNAPLLQKISGNENWWNGLQWEGGDRALALGQRHIFVPI